MKKNDVLTVLLEHGVVANHTMVLQGSGSISHGLVVLGKKAVGQAGQTEE